MTPEDKQKFLDACTEQEHALATALSNMFTADRVNVDIKFADIKDSATGRARERVAKELLNKASK